MVNKIDRPESRVDQVVDEVFDLFDRLGGTDEQLDFTTIYASAIQGYAVVDPEDQPNEGHNFIKKLNERIYDAQAASENER